MITCSVSIYNRYGKGFLVKYTVCTLWKEIVAWGQVIIKMVSKVFSQNHLNKLWLLIFYNLLSSKKKQWYRKYPKSQRRDERRQKIKKKTNNIRISNGNSFIVDFFFQVFNKRYITVMKWHLIFYFSLIDDFKKFKYQSS